MASGAAAAAAGEDAGGEVVEFGWEDASSDKPLSGRRLKALKEQKKKNRAGTFGEEQRQGERERDPQPAWQCVWGLRVCVCVWGGGMTLFVSGKG